MKLFYSLDKARLYYLVSNPTMCVEWVAHAHAHDLPEDKLRSYVELWGGDGVGRVVNRYCGLLLVRWCGMVVHSVSLPGCYGDQSARW